MINGNTDEPVENEYLIKLLLHEEKQFYDRANFFVAAHGLFFTAFVGLLTGATPIAGWLLFLPVVICIVGFVLSILWYYSSKFKIEKTIEPLRQIFMSRNLASIKSIVDDESKNPLRLFQPSLVDLIYKYAPILIAVAWISMLFIYTLSLNNWIPFRL